MSNYTKSFNFQNGVQVDDDNFVVTSGGLVGIGTSVPSKKLDVRGNADISGILTASGVEVGAAITVGSITIDAASGIITASKFVGDAGSLNGIVAIATDGFVQQAGSLSTTAKIGIKTDNPIFDLQIGSDPNSSVGVAVTNGNILVSGIVTTGILTVTTHSVFSGLSTFKNNLDVDGDVSIGTSVSIGGTVGVGSVYFRSNVKAIFGNNEDLSIYHDGSHSYIEDNGSGDLIAKTNIFYVRGHNDEAILTGSQDGNVALYFNDSKRFSTSGIGVTIYNQLDTTDLKVGGISTFVGKLDAQGDVDLGDNDTDTINIKARVGQDLDPVGNSTKDLGQADRRWKDLYLGNGLDTKYINLTGIATFADDSKLNFGASDDLQIYHQSSDNTSRILSKERDLLIYTNQPNSVTIQTNEENAIVATANKGVDLYHDAILQFATVSTGASVYNQIDFLSLSGGTSGLSTFSGTIKYGNESLEYPYSSRRSFDILNNDSGNVNFYLDAGNIGLNTGDFYWHKGSNNARLMTLTHTGRLGIGVTEPEQTLRVVGITSILGNTFVEGDFHVSANTIFDGNLNIPTGTLTLNTALSADVIGDVTGDLTGNVNATAGLSTFNYINMNGSSYTQAGGVALDASTQTASFRNVGVGTTDPSSGADFKLCGQTYNDRFLIMPRVTTDERELIQEPEGGSVIYNSTSDRLEVYIVGVSTWVGIATTT